MLDLRHNRLVNTFTARRRLNLSAVILRNLNGTVDYGHESTLSLYYVCSRCARDTGLTVVLKLVGVFFSFHLFFPRWWLALLGVATVVIEDGTPLELNLTNNNASISPCDSVCKKLILGTAVGVCTCYAVRRASSGGVRFITASLRRRRVCSATPILPVGNALSLRGKICGHVIGRCGVIPLSFHVAACSSTPTKDNLKSSSAVIIYVIGTFTR